MKSLKVAALALVVFVVAALGGRAYAYWTATGEDSTTATVAVLDAPATPGAVIPPDSVASTAPLVPGGDGDLVLVLRNTNAFDVTLTAITSGTRPATSDIAGCVGAEVVGLNAITFVAPATVLPAGVTVTVRLPAAVHMDVRAPSACQGATFTIPVRVEVTQ